MVLSIFKLLVQTNYLLYGSLEKMAEPLVNPNDVCTSEAIWLKCGKRNNKYSELRICPVV